MAILTLPVFWKLQIRSPFRILSTYIIECCPAEQLSMCSFRLLIIATRLELLTLGSCKSLQGTILLRSYRLGLASIIPSGISKLYSNIVARLLVRDLLVPLGFNMAEEFRTLNDLGTYMVTDTYRNVGPPRGSCECLFRFHNCYGH